MSQGQEGQLAPASTLNASDYGSQRVLSQKRLNGFRTAGQPQ